MCSIKMMYQIGGGFRLLSRNKCLHSQLLSRMSPGGYFSVDDRHTKRQYSAVMKCSSQTLQLKKLQNSSLLMANCRSYHYSLFTHLTDALESMYLFVHDYSGLPWWAVILICTIPPRFTLSYIVHRYNTIMRYKGLYIHQELLPVKRRRAKITIDQQRKGLTKDEKSVIVNDLTIFHQKRLNKEHGYSAYSGLMLSLLPLPYWFANSVTLRKLCGARLPFYIDDTSDAMSASMHYEGLFWFKDLVACDPYHILPIAVGLTYFASIELNRLLDKNYGKKRTLTPYEEKAEKVKKVISGFLSAWSLFTIYIFWNMPSAMVFFWLASGLLGFCNRLVFVHPSFEKFVVPDKYHMEQDSNPYRTILKNMKRRYNPFNWFLKI